MASGISPHSFPTDEGNSSNYQSACPWDIYSPLAADEMVSCS